MIMTVLGAGMLLGGTSLLYRAATWRNVREVPHGDVLQAEGLMEGILLIVFGLFLFGFGLIWMLAGRGS
ncbi:MAG: hypothetical protein R6W77_16620 [Trueperaceae bacterium]